MKTKHKHGLHIEYSPVNQAWFLMWHHEVLHIGTKKDMEWWMKDLLRGLSLPSDTEENDDCGAR